MKLHRPLTIDEIKTENIKKNSVGKVIEESKSFIIAGSPRIYHGFSRDWITGEVFRRVEPNGRTMGEYLREVMMPEFNINGVICGPKGNEWDYY
jgi:hypothetical protein